jgi:hypothetical protein
MTTGSDTGKGQTEKPTTAKKCRKNQVGTYKFKQNEKLKIKHQNNFWIFRRIKHGRKIGY